MARHTILVDVHVIIRNSLGEVFMLRRHNTGYHDGDFSLVAGHLEPDETLITGAIRETKEEVDVDVEPDLLELVHVLHHRSNNDRIALFFEARSWKRNPRNAEPTKCDEACWFSVPELPANTVPYIKHVLNAISSGNLYSEFGWDQSAARG